MCRGVFFDPKHGGCLRRVYPSGRKQLVVRGVFGDELVAAVTGDALATPAPSSPVSPPRVVGPCHDEDAHAGSVSLK